MNRIKNGIILVILVLFLALVALMPVKCVFKTLTGIYCPACYMTRAFICLLNFDIIHAIQLNILSIPIFILIALSFIMLIIDILKNQFKFIPKLISFFGKHYVLIIMLLIVSFIYNNLKFLIFANM